jgi:hypothetical protein
MHKLKLDDIVVHSFVPVDRKSSSAGTVKAHLDSPDTTDCMGVEGSGYQSCLDQLTKTILSMKHSGNELCGTTAFVGYRHDGSWGCL